MQEVGKYFLLAKNCVQGDSSHSWSSLKCRYISMECVCVCVCTAMTLSPLNMDNLPLGLSVGLTYEATTSTILVRIGCQS